MKGQTNRKKRGSRLVNIALALVFLVGLGLLTYPSISQFYNSVTQGRAIAAYDDSLSRMTKRDFDAMWQEVEAYNAQITQAGISFKVLEEGLQRYNQLLDPAGIGMMGHIEIPAIGVDLPIYHGIEDTVLQIGVGHIPGTSLPAGGASTHSVFSGHRGLPTSKLFTDLDKVHEGDLFMVHVLDRTLAYEVDQIRIVLPNELDDLRIVEGEDLCTLVTCTPYAINTHRLLVRGHRTEYPYQGYVPADGVVLDPILAASIVSVPIFLGLFVYLVVQAARRRRMEAQALAGAGEVLEDDVIAEDVITEEDKLVEEQTVLEGSGYEQGEHE